MKCRCLAFDSLWRPGNWGPEKSVLVQDKLGKVRTRIRTPDLLTLERAVTAPSACAQSISPGASAPEETPDGLFEDSMSAESGQRHLAIW